MSDSFLDSAHRHRSDAKHLATDRRFQNAGHLIGFAAECLVKDILERASITIDKASGFREHFPKLQTKVRMNGRTRVMRQLTPIVRGATFLHGWAAEGRYEHDISDSSAEKRFLSWVAEVDALFRTAGIP